MDTQRQMRALDERAPPPQAASTRPPIVANFLSALGDGSFRAAQRFAQESSDYLTLKSDFLSFAAPTIACPSMHHLKDDIEGKGWEGLDARIACSYRHDEGPTAFDYIGCPYEEIAASGSFMKVRAHELNAIAQQYPPIPDDRFGDKAMQDASHGWALGVVKNILILADERARLWFGVKLKLYGLFWLMVVLLGLTQTAVALMPTEAVIEIVIMAVVMTGVGIGGWLLASAVKTEGGKELKRLNGTFNNTTLQSSQRFGELFRSRQSALDSLNKECLERAEKARDETWAQASVKDWSIMRFRYRRVAVWSQKRMQADHRVLKLHSDMIPRAYAGFTAYALYAAHYQSLWLRKGVMRLILMIASAVASAAGVFGVWSGWIPWDPAIDKTQAAISLAIIAGLAVHMGLTARGLAKEILRPQAPDDVFQNIAPAKPETGINDDQDFPGLDQLRLDALRQLREAQNRR